jgi:cytochrome d ubiquinol oxidase subunit I
MPVAGDIHRLHFAFTITFHYIFPQLTMGLALLIVVLKTVAWRRRDEHSANAARFWARVFAITFVTGVVTGVPMEFQFGTNWSAFSRAAGGVIGQTLALEGVFAFFLESGFLGLFLFGEQRLGRTAHWLASVLVWAGSWLSGFFIVATNAWMQHPVGYTVGPHGEYVLASCWQLLGNPWLGWEYPHVMLGAVQSGRFVMAAVGSYYVLARRHADHGRTFVRTGVIVGVVATILQLYPTGDSQGRVVADHQPVTLAAMEGLFQGGPGAPLAIIGQPDVEHRRLDNPVLVPKTLSFLTYRRWTAVVRGLDAFPRSEWPDHVPIVYYAYHIMVGLGTLFIAALAAAAFLLWRGRLFAARPMLWALMLAGPFPFIANTAGWITAKTGRQPWLVHGLLRTAHGVSPQISSGNAWFTLLGFMGLYFVLGVLYLGLVGREIAHGPTGAGPLTHEEAA